MSRLQDVFAQVIERPPPERSVRLDELCGDDDELKARVRSMLDAHGKLGGFLAEPDTASLIAESGPGRTIGHYAIRGEIGAGGMGMVYDAVQEHPHRTVALKVLRRGMASRSMIRRFRHEAEILGLLRHPNIAQVYEAGTVDEGEGAQPWFAMEFIRGEPLLAQAESKRLGTRQRLDLFVKVCDAVQYAHQKGIIHRDLKPDNVLVDEHGEPKILDFGVARLTDSDIQVTTLQTDVGQLVGTVSYMSPEQATGDPRELDTRSDVYALGVMLYELLSGRLPYDLSDKSIPQVLRVIGEEDPSRLSMISRVFRGDLDTIAAKALEKEKGRRYQTAAELAADIRHYLKDEPIVARRASTFYQLKKFTRRNRVLVAGVAATLVALVLGLITTLWQAVEARGEAARALTVKDFLSDTLAATDFAAAGQRLTIGHVLDNAAGDVGEVFAGEPETEAEVRHLLGLSYASMSELPKSIEQLRLAVEIRTRELGADHRDTLESRYQLAEKLRKDFEWGEAETVLRPVVEARRRILGDTHRDTLQAIYRLADVLIPLRKLDEGERLTHEAIESFADLYGQDSEQAILARRELADLRAAEFRWVEVEEIALDNLARARRSLGDEHWITLEFTFILGFTCHVRKWDEAEPLLRTAVKRRQRLFGDDDDTVLQWSVSLGQALGRNGQEEEGREMLRTAAAKYRQLYGEDNLRTANAMNHLATAEWRAGNLETAEQLQRRVTEVMRAKLGSEHPFPVETMSYLAWILCDRGRPPEAEPLLREAMNSQRRILGETHWRTLMTTCWLGSCLADQGRFDESEALLLSAHKTEGACGGDEHLKQLSTQVNLVLLVALYDAWGRPDKAAEYQALRRDVDDAVDEPGFLLLAGLRHAPGGPSDPPGEAPP
jgi:predicted Ser/Thr protein kinase